MIIKIVGERPVSFKDQNGDQVTGKSFNYLYQDDHVNGYACDKVFVRSGRQCPFQVNGEYNVLYNRYGKIDLDSVTSV